MHEHAYRTPWVYLNKPKEEVTPEDIAELQAKLRAEGQHELADMFDAVATDPGDVPQVLLRPNRDQRGDEESGPPAVDHHQKEGK
jgi:hypothetical protein